jgi:hypothetical protein
MIPTLALVAVICGALDPDEDPPPPQAVSNSAANATINRDLRLDIDSSLYCPRGIFQPRYLFCIFSSKNHHSKCNAASEKENLDYVRH